MRDLGNFVAGILGGSFVAGRGEILATIDQDMTEAAGRAHRPKARDGSENHGAVLTSSQHGERESRCA